MLLYAPGILLYKWTLKENQMKVKETKLDKALMVIIVILAIWALVGLVAGKISI
jgi:arginine:ornithine antiporter/lysine permease